ncbi:hypothetical protein FOL47_010690 [Perkinsus chesapeaki]|uniref:Uncharacterized protein n=1 Tax=Perkinsus chesapeaki TaxID=330153 RepID=A0A7J6MP16_PERCH|nr:hypothetical protein FOL47_010690 [Perkinsus chesapeaki]
MLLPSHVEALRCMMVERLWKDSISIGPLPELMVDIMAYTPKPTLTLDCPMEEIVINIDKEPAYIFTEGGVVYGVRNQDNCFSCEKLYPFGGSITLARTSSGRGQFYFDSVTGHLFILHDDNGVTLLTTI